MSAIHLQVPFKVSAVGYYVNTACGCYIIASDAAMLMTADPEKITCRRCLRTRVARDANSARDAA